MKSFASKIWGLIIVFILCTIAFMYVFTDFLYEKLYVADSEQSMIEIGTKLQSMYRGGVVTDEFVADVEHFNQYSNIDVFAVRNPKELSACVPFEVDYDTLIGPEERKQLLEGKSITKIGYEERFGRQVISVVLPLTDQSRLEGILYLYYPLAKISELAKQEVLLLAVGAIIFTIVAGFFVFQGLRHILKPLHALHAAVEKMSVGDYDARVAVESKDEIGQLSDAFNKMAAAIQEEDEVKKTFLATVSHELRTPISYVKGYSESIKNGFIEGHQKEEAISLIYREASRMERMTNELMQLVRTDVNVNTDSFMPIVLSELLREVSMLLEMAAKRKNIAFEMQLDEGIIVNVDEEQLKQVFINIAENAIRYSDESSIIKIKTVMMEKKARVEVIDHGIGIPAEDLPKVTERFYRVNKARSRMDGGSGLGLSIVDKLVKQHGGELQIQSNVGEGTTVIVLLPIMEDE